MPTWPSPVSTTGMDADTDGLPRSDILDLTTKFNDVIALRGAAGGICDLDGSGRVPTTRLEAKLAAIAGLTGAADKGLHFTGVGAAAVHTQTAFARTLLDDADAATARATLGLETVAQAEAEAGSATTERAWTAQRVAQAIAALTPDPTAPAILQVVSTTIAAATGTTTIPDDNTAPLSSEGTQIATLAITPSSAASTVRLSGSFNMDFTTALIVAVFRGSTLVGAMRYFDEGSTGAPASPMSIDLEDSPGVTSATTYSIRVGMFSTTSAWFVNRTSGSATALGSSMANSRFTAEELAA